MGQGISEVLPFAIVLILFSNRARVNGPVFLVGWVLGRAVAGTPRT